MTVTYSGREVLITGGLGFLGSNLAIRLVNLGASVSIVDAMVDGCGGNVYNIAPVANKVRVVRASVGAPRRFRALIRRAGVIFNLAGEISHIHSMRWPKRDALLNASSQLSFLEECVRSAPGVRIVYAGTRQVYGVPKYLPVDEEHPIGPVDFNGIHKGAALMYHVLYARTKKLDAVVLNLSNLYGPRMALSSPCQGVLANFVRKLVSGRRLEVFGDGRQLRDPMYVDEAVDAFLAAGSVEKLPSRIYNVGGPEPLPLGRIAGIASRAAGQDPPLFRPFPPDREMIDIGSYYADTSRIRRELGWKPCIGFEDGIARTLAFYQAELPHYLESFDAEPACALDAAVSPPAMAACP
ncbi:MAG: NAD-dependent epimerase/dehydratase family protein [Bryobacteraceae bacterium]